MCRDLALLTQVAGANATHAGCQEKTQISPTTIPHPGLLPDLPYQTRVPWGNLIYPTKPVYHGAT